MRWYPRHEWTEGMSPEQLAEWNSASWPEVGGAGWPTPAAVLPAVHGSFVPWPRMEQMYVWSLFVCLPVVYINTRPQLDG